MKKKTAYTETKAHGVPTMHSDYLMLRNKDPYVVEVTSDLLFGVRTICATFVRCPNTNILIFFISV
jgi:hypothetical protein